MPVARNTDPWTSWVAARSVTDLIDKQLAVLYVLQTYGPLTDNDISVKYQQHSELTKQSPSGLRTRRNELKRKGFVRDTGKIKRLESNQPSIVWEAS